MPGRRLGAHKRVAGLLLIVLAGLVVTCQSTSAVTEQFTPPYLRLRLCAGKAQLQCSGSSEWTAMEGEISIEDSCQIVADAVDGAQFCLDDGSTLELAPEAAIEVRNPRVFPRLQVTLQDGSLLFEAQKPAYEFVTPVGPVTFLSVPSRLEIKISGGTTHLRVEEGAVTCALEMETLTVLACWEMYAAPGGDPEVAEYCTASVTGTPFALTPSPSPTWTPTPSPTPTSTLSPTPSPTMTPTQRIVVPTNTPIPVPPTDTPSPPQPPPEPPPQPTKPPPQPTEPPPQPTEPPPQPTEPPPTEERPTVAPP